MESAYVIKPDCRKTPTTGRLAMITLPQTQTHPLAFNTAAQLVSLDPPHIAERARGSISALSPVIRCSVGHFFNELNRVFLAVNSKVEHHVSAWEGERENQTCTDRAGGYDCLQCGITSDWHKHLMAFGNKPHTHTKTFVLLIKGTEIYTFLF